MTRVTPKALQVHVLGLASAGALAAVLVTAAPANATVVQCGSAWCYSDYTIEVDGSAVGGGRFGYDARTGEVSLDTSTIIGNGAFDPNMGAITWTLPDSDQIRITNIGGNADPILTFGIGATTGATGTTVAFSFNLPIALDGTIRADSSIGYVLTSAGAGGARIAPTLGSTHILTAYEVDTTAVPNVGELNKGVDAGTAFAFAGGPATQVSPVFSATNFFTGNLAYDLMAVRVAFALSPNSSVGVSGFVQQVIVPLPAALPLLLSGLAGFGLITRRRLARA